MPKIQRNAPCPCGSGQKFKKCCIDSYQNHNFTDSSCHDPHCGEDHNASDLSNHSVLLNETDQ
jgi:hypothetical protein